MIAGKPAMTPIGGSGPARAGAAVVALGLAAVIVIALAGRPHELRPGPSFALPLVVSDVQGSPSPTLDVTPLPMSIVPGHKLGADAFAAIGVIAGRQYPILLYQNDAGVLEGRVRLPFPREATTGTVELAQLWSRSPGTNFQSIGRWPLPLDVLMPEFRGSGVLLTVTQTGRAGPSTGNRLVRAGFAMTIRAESRADFGMLFVTIASPWCPGSETAGGCAPPEQARRTITGDDGIFGLPGHPWRGPDSTPVPHYVFQYRTRAPAGWVTR